MELFTAAVPGATPPPPKHLKNKNIYIFYIFSISFDDFAIGPLKLAPLNIFIEKSIENV